VENYRETTTIADKETIGTGRGRGREE